ncbi:class I SAM-dependent methyltransferase [Candidatus Hoaglandella endobia]|uniref:Ubiquinone/menaquinone biosynthesis C-methyltransferase UbiE n=1 Tax=Candidatus Hoaglandella endobia TaxID=1778263 RepID=A0A143WTD3_9ENTR|nr:class I SAM-dependent methyltransferase [Candidatus Hoaglandella endobia]CUX96978.1 Ubiquinone/menaquinone biosynthesis C-methyltransferase UbiE [Candidatus Hoaglandella endobia]
MKPAQLHKVIVSPTSWDAIPKGTYYRQVLEQGLKKWWPKLFGFYLLKIGALSADLDTGDCAILHQINIGLEGKNLHVIADLYQLPFANKSADACLLAHTLSYIGDPHQLLREVDRVLIDDGWLIITTFNPISLLGLGKFFSFFFRQQPYKSRMYTPMRLLDWLGVLNFEVLYCTQFQALPWRWQRGPLLRRPNCPAIGCLSIIIARKRSLPLNLLTPLKIRSLRTDCSVQ